MISVVFKNMTAAKATRSALRFFRATWRRVMPNVSRVPISNFSRSRSRRAPSAAPSRRARQTSPSRFSLISGARATVFAFSSAALTAEIERHYRYWDTRRNDQGERVTPVGRICLVGGSANMRGLPEYIAGHIHAPVELGNVWRHICDFDFYIPPIDRRTSLQFATAAGLALRTA